MSSPQCIVVTGKTKLCCQAVAVPLWKWGHVWPITKWVVVAVVRLDRHKELELELVWAQLGSIQELVAV